MAIQDLPALGQRWLSNAEVELGLGTIVAMDERTISLLFPASGENRNYARKNAPITRVRFAVGDTATHHEGWQFKVTEVLEANNTLEYLAIRLDNSESVSVKETFLSHDFVLTEPQDRLFNGHYDGPRWFDMRKQSIVHRHNHLTSPLLGFLGARVSLIPHQLHIAKEVGQRMAPRVLLADEVGLGKTIEAAMIIHQQLLTERAHRVLIVVPDSLVNQWLVEMLRKFNLCFAIFDEERCESLAEEGGNPFDSEQLVLCSLNFLTHNTRYFQQASESQWDLLIVDEAHHLKWSPGNPSQEYQVIDELASKTKGVLLLTATPDQLGHESHFARLRLLDANRFHDYAVFLKEEQEYAQLAETVTALLGSAMLTEEHYAQLKDKLSDLNHNLDELNSNHSLREQLVTDLLDRHGTGRVLFRNSRKTITGFPGRYLDAARLDEPVEYAENSDIPKIKAHLTPEIYYAGTDFWTDIDTRVNWFVETLQNLKGDKVLTICANSITALDLAETLRVKTGMRATVFHEGMSIIERDKAANYFAQSEDGAQVLITSEIGSEGRNFQFAHHLVLFDLPLNPDLLEQRIGRLDRIGQKHDIQIHVPVFSGSAQEVLLRWFDEGLDAFSHTCPIGATVYDEQSEQLESCLFEPEQSSEIEQLLTQTKQIRQELLAKLEKGRDKLLELNSSGIGKVEAFVEQLEDSDQSPTLERFMTQLFDTLGILQEEKDDHCYLLTPTESMVSHLPGLQDEGMTITYERDTATHLEHVHFISWDHPLVHNAIDMLLADVHGKSSMAFTANKALPAGYYWFECLYVLAAKGDKRLQLNQYFPDTPISFSVSAKAQEEETFFPLLDKVPRKIGSQLINALSTQFQKTLVIAEKIGSEKAQLVKQEKVSQIEQKLSADITRLKALQKVNPSVREDEIELLTKQREGLLNAANNAQLRLEAVRVVVNNP